MLYKHYSELSNQFLIRQDQNIFKLRLQVLQLNSFSHTQNCDSSFQYFDKMSNWY